MPANGYDPSRNLQFSHSLAFFATHVIYLFASFPPEPTDQTRPSRHRPWRQHDCILLCVLHEFKWRMRIRERCNQPNDNSYFLFLITKIIYPTWACVSECSRASAENNAFEEVYLTIVQSRGWRQCHCFEFLRWNLSGAHYRINHRVDSRELLCPRRTKGVRLSFCVVFISANFIYKMKQATLHRRVQRPPVVHSAAFGFVSGFLGHLSLSILMLNSIIVRLVLCWCWFLLAFHQIGTILF